MPKTTDKIILAEVNEAQGLKDYMNEEYNYLKETSTDVAADIVSVDIESSSLNYNPSEIKEMAAAAKQSASEIPEEFVYENDIDEEEVVDKETSLAAERKLESVLELRGIGRATKSQKRVLYSDKEIFAINEELEVETENSLQKQTYLELTASLKSNRPISAVIDGVEVVNKQLCAIIMYNSFKVYIPFSEMGISETKKFKELDKTTTEYFNTCRLLLNMRIGSEVSFIVKGIDEKNEIAMASRRAAMNVLAKTYYLTKSKKTNDYLLTEGSKVEARVVSVVSRGIFVEVFGIEAYIPLTEISYTRIPDIMDVYFPGDRVIVKLTKVEKKKVESRGKLGIVINIEASVKQAQDDPRKKYFDSVSVGNKYRGTVTLVTDYGVFVRIGGENGKIDCLCPFPKRGGIPTKGSQCLIHIIQKDDEEHLLYGTIQRWVPIRRY